MALAEDTSLPGVTSTPAAEEDIRPDKNAKDEFKNLGAGFKDSLEGLNTDQLKAQLAEIHLLNQNNEAALKADQDVKNAQSKLSAAKECYVKERAELKLKAKYVTRMLSDGGDPVASQVTTNEVAAKSLASLG